MMNKRIPLYLYIAKNNPQGAANIITSFGLRKPMNEEDLVRGLSYVMQTQGEQGFIEMAKQHPDRKLILDVEEMINPKTIEVKSNACGCKSGFDGVSTPNNNYEPPTKENIRFLTKEDFEKFETNKKVNELEKKINKEDVAAEVKKTLDQSNNFITKNIPTIAILAVGLFLYAQLKK